MTNNNIKFSRSIYTWRYHTESHTTPLFLSVPPAADPPMQRTNLVKENEAFWKRLITDMGFDHIANSPSDPSLN